VYFSSTARTSGNFDINDLMKFGRIDAQGNRKNGCQRTRKIFEKEYQKMPRTMLRYSIEKFPEEKRKGYLSI